MSAEVPSVPELPHGPRAHKPKLAGFLAGSVLLHVWLVLGQLGALPDAPDIQLARVQEVELGIEAGEPAEPVEPGDPGASGEPPAAAPPAPPPPQPEPTPVAPKEPPQAHATASTDFALDAGTQDEPAPKGEALDGGSDPLASGRDAGAQSSAIAERSGEGMAPLGASAGLGFGEGGFGEGYGGPPGAIVGLHVDMARIRDSSLILETSALLELIPEWTQMLEGSGIDPQADLERVFVASPSLRRAGLVLSARVQGGQPRVMRAVAALAAERGQPAEWRAQGGLEVAPWHDRGPTERVVGLLGGDQVVIARPKDVARALAVAAAIAARHGKEPNMERFAGAGALLAMYQGEEVALSVEGVRHYLDQPIAYAPLGLRLSLRHLDELFAELRAYGYYPSAAAAQAALPELEALRARFLTHPKAQYLGLKSALADAELSQKDRTATLRVRLTLHQVRYLMAYVRRALTQP